MKAMVRKMVMMLSVVITPVWGCGPPPAREGNLHSDDPASKLYAIRRAGQGRDPSMIGGLVEQLDSDDPVVRMMAIVALSRITGTRMGYNPYASLVDRRAAIETWVTAVRERRLPHPDMGDIDE